MLDGVQARLAFDYIDGLKDGKKDGYISSDEFKIALNNFDTEKEVSLGKYNFNEFKVVANSLGFNDEALIQNIWQAFGGSNIKNVAIIDIFRYFIPINKLNPLLNEEGFIAALENDRTYVPPETILRSQAYSKIMSVLDDFVTFIYKDTYLAYYYDDIKNIDAIKKDLVSAYIGTEEAQNAGDIAANKDKYISAIKKLEVLMDSKSIFCGMSPDQLKLKYPGVYSYRKRIYEEEIYTIKYLLKI